MVGELKIGIIPSVAKYILPLFFIKISERFARSN
jgi:hypothetical protein